MEEIKSHINNIVFRAGVCAVVISCAVANGILQDAGYIDIFKNAATSLVGVIVYIYYYSLDDGRRIKEIPSQALFLLSFAVSDALVAYTCIEETGTVWMVAVAVTALAEGTGHAVPCHLLLMLQYALLSGEAQDNRQIIVFYGILGILLAFVLSEVNERKIFIYASVIFISLTFVLIIVSDGFNLQQTLDNRDFIIKCTAGDTVILVVSWITYNFNGKRQKSAAKVKISRRKNKKTDDKVLLKLIGKDSRLVKSMEQYSGTLYKHSEKVSRLSYEAACYIGCNGLLAKAGGMFHEAARIYEGRNYTEACRILAEEYRFPQELTDIILQHGMVSGKPGSYEAAIVMLSDSIVSADEYLERTGKRNQISDEKLVKGVFSKRMAKGTLDGSGLDKENIERLMDFYINNSF